MRLLLDTHLLIWAVSEPERLPAKAVESMNDEANELFFSAASTWVYYVAHPVPARKIKCRF